MSKNFNEWEYYFSISYEVLKDDEWVGEGIKPFQSRDQNDNGDSMKNLIKDHIKNKYPNDNLKVKFNPVTTVTQKEFYDLFSKELINLNTQQ